MVPDDLTLFSRTWKIVTMKRTAWSYLGDGYPTVKLVTRKEGREERAREKLLALVLERESREREKKSVLLTCERVSPFIVQIDECENTLIVMLESRRLTQSYSWSVIDR